MNHFLKYEVIPSIPCALKKNNWPNSILRFYNSKKGPMQKYNQYSNSAIRYEFLPCYFSTSYQLRNIRVRLNYMEHFNFCNRYIELYSCFCIGSEMVDGTSVFRPQTTPICRLVCVRGASRNTKRIISGNSQVPPPPSEVLLGARPRTCAVHRVIREDVSGLSNWWLLVEPIGRNTSTQPTFGSKFTCQSMYEGTP